MVVRKYTKNISTRKNYNFVDPLNPPEQRITATGGTITSAGAYIIHTFTANATFTVTQGSYQEIDYLMIAGGGAAGRGNGSGACSGAAGGCLMNWLGLANTYSQCIGPKLYTQSGDVWNIYPGPGGTYVDNNSNQNSGSDSWLVKNGVETLRTFAGGHGGGGTALSVGGNGGCGGGSLGTGGNGTIPFQTAGYSNLTGELQYQFNYGRSTLPYKQGNGNRVANNTFTLAASSGVWTPPIAVWSFGTTDTLRGVAIPQTWPGYGIKTSFGGTFQTYGNAGYMGTAYVTAGTPATPTTPGSGGHSMITTGIAGSGSAGQVIFRYLSNKTVAAANVEMLIVGGGGAQGGQTILAGPGGGGGSVIYYGNEPTGNTGGPVTLYNGTYPVIIGAGGTLNTTQGVYPNPMTGGTSSVVGVPCNTVTYYGTQGANTPPPAANTWGAFDAYGGGSRGQQLCEMYGSGHGVYGGQVVYAYGLPNPDHGFRGGAGFSGTPGCHGGGGGAGGLGGDAVNLTQGGVGGIGRQFSISGTATYYGGGGGGARSTTGGTTAVGGLGGGANGFNGTATTTSSGSPNTGGGGGGGQGATSGGSGGSGIVIIRYPSTYPAANGTTGSPTITVSGGWRTYTFTQSGSISFG